MRIAVNTRFLLKDRLEGIGAFTHETLKRIVKNHPEHDFIFFFDRAYDQEFIYGENIEAVSLFPQARHPFLWYLWFEWSIPRALKKHKADIFISADGYCSLRSDVPTHMVLHDIAFETHPDMISGLVSKYYKKYTPLFSHKAKRLATVSEYSKNDIVNQYGIAQDSIDVVFNGASPRFQPLDDDSVARDKFSNGKPYFLFVGALHPRKNIANLFRAFDQFKKSDVTGCQLLIVGRKGWATEEIETTYDEMSYKDDVIFTGRLSNDDLGLALGGALALTYVPVFEGFGIPIVEAQYCDIPVITSNVTSMPEVAGDSALLVDPLDVESIASALSEVSSNEELRNQLVSKGRENRLRFSWDRSAELYWESIMRMVSENGLDNA